MHNGNQVNSQVPESVIAQSVVIQRIFESHFNASNEPFQYAAMTGGSDYLPFLETGNIPSGCVRPRTSASLSPSLLRRANMQPCRKRLRHDLPRRSGLATGASGLKRTAERATFGGFANAAYDPCYHQYCDDEPNVSSEALRMVRGAIALTCLGRRRRPLTSIWHTAVSRPPRPSLPSRFRQCGEAAASALETFARQSNLSAFLRGE